MYREYCNYNQSLINLETEIPKLFNIVDSGLVDGVAVPLYFLKEISSYLPPGMTIASPVGYPFGTTDPKIKQHEALGAIRSGANAIDLVFNPFFLQQKKYKQFFDEVKTHKNICDEYGASLRLVVDHNIIGMNKSVKLSRLVDKLDLDFLIPSISYHHDDIYDNILLCHFIELETKISTIFSGYAWLPKHYKAIMETDIFGARFFSDKFLNGVTIS